MRVRLVVVDQKWLDNGFVGILEDLEAWNILYRLSICANGHWGSSVILLLSFILIVMLHELVVRGIRVVILFMLLLGLLSEEAFLDCCDGGTEEYCSKAYECK